MKRFAFMTLMLSLLCPAIVKAADISSIPGQSTARPVPAGTSQKIEISRDRSRPVGQGPAEYFTGSVSMDRLFQQNDHARAAAATVTFQPGARTAWHRHPLGQRLIVTAGTGRVQSWGGPIEGIRPGDVVWIPPGVKHWHGAAPDTAMTHIAIQEALDGKVVQWLEKVTDEQYLTGPVSH